MLADAEEPAITIFPKEFMDDWMTMLETEKSIPCTPAGIPMIRMGFIFDMCILSFLISSLKGPFSLMRVPMISDMLTICESTVARATPSTAMPMTMTKNRFRQTLSTPAIRRKYKGLFVSPLALNMPEPKL